jgi:hypothetical protein
MQKYQTTIEKIGQTTLIAPIPEEIAGSFLGQSNKRVIIRIRGQHLHCAIHFRKDIGHYFYCGKQVWRRLQVREGDIEAVEIEADTTTYQAEMPEELEEVLSTDPDGMEAFEALTPGRQRSILFMIGRLKRIDSRIRKALSVVEKLKMGVTDLKQL